MLYKLFEKYKSKMSKQSFKIAVAEKMIRSDNSSQEVHVNNEIDHQRD